MTTLYVYSNRHIKTQACNITRGSYILVENEMSRKRWALFFRHYTIDESSLDIKYITAQEFFKMKRPIFNNIIGNPPYQDGNQGLWQSFAIQAIKLLEPGGTLSFVTPNSWANGSNLGTEKNIFNSIMSKK